MDEERDTVPEQEPLGAGLFSILREIVSLAPKKSKAAFLEERTRHAYEAVIKLFDLLRDEYPGEEGAEIRKRFVNAVRTRSYAKVAKGFKKIRK